MNDVKQLKMMTLNDVLNQIEDGMTLGIGTGSTIELLVPKIAQLVEEKNYDIKGVCTSNKTAFLAKELNIEIVDVNDVEKIDLAIDGADEVDPNLNLIKGGGGALFREKVIDEMADRFVVIADENKVVNYLGETFKLPVEVDKFNWYQVARKIETIDGVIVQRRVTEDVPVTTDNGNNILDCALPKGVDPYEMHEFLIHITGVLETGYFLDITDEAIIGTQQGVKKMYRE